MCVPSKPFNINYTLSTSDGHVVLNGEQITKIEAKRYVSPGLNPLGEQAWIIIFHLADGTYYTVEANDWTKQFTKDLFGEV